MGLNVDDRFVREIGIIFSFCFFLGLKNIKKIMGDRKGFYRKLNI